ncbi:cyclohexanone monooxygenase [Bradyrhizobium sp. UNPF46]|uniref:flavin-containing monooxygenase n=1 Tax=Bradyrhizobium sp. UNPF46 TaxID=1141168 RepID=UPI00114E48D4|nr:NAD(P)/FAD-dependent oxidoreductase [Bradyrhizobium sp. UNPF46]TQF27669.1 cyclohexanone monooxygenase [Bradyrhizobium sp. UNPF46]
MSNRLHFDAVVIGAGFAGMFMLQRLRELGLRTRVLEAGSDVGGTWYWNRYPGARCDVESMEYSYSFDGALQQEWEWSERYSAQPEILKYAQYVADRFELRKDIQFQTKVVSAKWSEKASRWTVLTDTGERFECQFLITAVGCLSLPNRPKFPGDDEFAGQIYHTGLWPKAPVDFRGKRVGVIGTGSSAIQLVPLVAKDADRLFVFQRTPNYSLPAKNRKLDPVAVNRYKSRYDVYRRLARKAAVGIAAFPTPIKSALEVDDVERDLTYTHAWSAGSTGFSRAYIDIIRDEEANLTAAEFARARIRDAVKNKKVAEKLVPTYPIGTKRLCLDTGYFETFDRPNVDLVDVRSDPIVSLTREGLRTVSAEYALDAIVFATGFDAVTGPLQAIDIRNQFDQALSEKWKEGPQTYLGLMTSGFKNLFMITGPGSPSILVNVFVAIEQHVEWITQCLTHMRQENKSVIDAEETAERHWREEVDAIANRTLLAKANSWYVGANIEGKPRVFLPYAGGMAEYTAVCERVVAEGYSGFQMS